MNWADAGSPMGSQGMVIGDSFLDGFIWCENIGWVNLGDGTPVNGSDYQNLNATDFGVNLGPSLTLEGLAWGENIGWIKFGPIPTLPAAQQARYDAAALRLRGYAWGENVGWINLDDATHYVGTLSPCGSPDFDGDGDTGTDLDIEAFFLCLGGNCCPTCGSPDFDGDGDTGTDLDIEAFFRVLGGGSC
mgnify:CR=1 FL=1